MLKKLSVIFISFVMVFSMVACSSTTTEKKEETKEEVVKNSEFEKVEKDLEEDLSPLPKKDTKVKLAAIESTLANSFWVTMKEGYEDAAKEYGVSIDVLATESDSDTTGQLNILNDCLAKDYDGIAVSPLSERNLIPGIVSANKEDVKLIAVGNGVDKKELEKAKGHIEAFITSDFKNQGAMQAKYVIEKTNSKGKVVVIEGTPGATQSDARKNGAKETLEKAGMDVVVVTANFDKQQAYDQMTSALQSNPDIVGVVCGNDVMALGAIEALKDKDAKDGVIVTGIDFTEEGKESIKSGELDASVAMSPYLYGKAGVILLLKAVEGQKITEDTVWTPETLVTAENVDSMEGWK